MVGGSGFPFCAQGHTAEAGSAGSGEKNRGAERRAEDAAGASDGGEPVVVQFRSPGSDSSSGGMGSIIPSAQRVSCQSWMIASSLLQTGQ